MSKLKNMDFLSDKINNSSTNIGFDSKEDSEEDYDSIEEPMYLEEDEEYPPLDEMHGEDIDYVKEKLKHLNNTRRR